MKFKAAIFDMDGTIILTEEIWQESAIKLIQTRCKTILSDKQKSTIITKIAGSGLQKAAQIIQQAQQEFCTKNQQADSLETIMEEYQKLTISLFTKNIPFVSGFKNFHNKLTAHHIPTAIATNCPIDVLQATNNILHLDQFFASHIYSVSQINNLCKPNPAIYLYAAEKLGIAPQECVAFEDSIPGIAAAKAAGMYCIGIKNHDHPEFVHQADMSINSYDQIKIEELFS